MISRSSRLYRLLFRDPGLQGKTLYFISTVCAWGTSLSDSQSQGRHTAAASQWLPFPLSKTTRFSGSCSENLTQGGVEGDINTEVLPNSWFKSERGRPSISSGKALETRPRPPPDTHTHTHACRGCESGTDFQSPHRLLQQPLPSYVLSGDITLLLPHQQRESIFPPLKFVLALWLITL